MCACDFFVGCLACTFSRGCVGFLKSNWKGFGMYVCMNTCMYVNVWMYICMYPDVCMYSDACMRVCLHAFIYVCVCACMYVWNSCMHACIYMCMYVCWFVYIHACKRMHVRMCAWMYKCICSVSRSIWREMSTWGTQSCTPVSRWLFSAWCVIFVRAQIDSHVNFCSIVQTCSTWFLDFLIQIKKFNYPDT